MGGILGILAKSWAGACYSCSWYIFRFFFFFGWGGGGGREGVTFFIYFICLSSPSLSLADFSIKETEALIFVCNFLKKLRPSCIVLRIQRLEGKQCRPR